VGGLIYEPGELLLRLADVHDNARHFLSFFGQGECKPCPTGVKPNMTLLLAVRNAKEGDGTALCLRSTATYFAACA
jgi:hypothetical protein